MTVKCGNRKVHGSTNTYHVSTADVKACFLGSLGTPVAEVPVAEKTAPAEARELTDNEASTLERMRVSLGTTPEESAYWKGLWAEEPDEDEVQEQHIAAQPMVAAAQAERIRPALRKSPKGREIPSNFGGTDKQFDLLFSLNEERGLGLDLSQYGSVGVASRMITAIFNGEVKPVAAAKPAGPVLADQDGIYRNPETGEIFKLQYNRASGDGRHLYAKQLVVTEGDWPDAGMAFELKNIPLDHAPDGKLDWRYVGAISKAGVLPTWRVTREEAAAFGALYGVCIRCGRDLTAEVSIERAMGPVCAGKMGW